MKCQVGTLISVKAVSAQVPKLKKLLNNANCFDHLRLSLATIIALLSTKLKTSHLYLMRSKL